MAPRDRHGVVRGLGRLGGLVALAAALVGCSPDYIKIARETFSLDRSCPLDRVTATARPDLSWTRLTRPDPKPPSEIAGDPAQVRAWEAEEKKKQEISDGMTRVHLVTGCNEKRYYGCGRARNGPYCAAMAVAVP